MTDGDVIRLEQRVAAPPASVFRYLTESALWSRWQGRQAQLDPQPGGRFQVTMPDGQTVEGEFVDVQRDSRVVITWGWREHPRMPPGTTIVEFELIPDGAGTLVKLTHRGLPAEDLPIHRLGWEAFLPRLDLVVRGIDAGANPM
jgi:uncharacterized protein YndB with AHSA1/START domain